MKKEKEKTVRFSAEWTEKIDEKIDEFMEQHGIFNKREALRIILDQFFNSKKDKQKNF